MEPPDALQRNLQGELLLALVSRQLTDLPTMCSALCVSKHARQALHRKATHPTLSFTVGVARSVYDSQPQSLQHVAQQCFWLGSHAEMVARLKVCSTVVLDADCSILHEHTARAAEDIACTALLHPHLKLRELHVDSIYHPASILQRIQNPNFLTRLEVSSFTPEGLSATLCTALGRLHHLRQLKLQSDNTDHSSSLQHPVMLASVSHLTPLTRLCLSTIVPVAEYQHLPHQLLWLEISYLPRGATLSQVTSLQTLRLVNPDLPADQLVAVANSIRSLTAVELAYSNFLMYAPVDHAVSPASPWSKIAKLRALDLWYSDPDHNSSWVLVYPKTWSNTLYDDIAAAIQQCTGLTHLALAFDYWELSEISPAAMLNSLTNLESLALGVGLDGPGGYRFSTFANTLTSHSRLQSLALDLPNMSTQAVYELAAATQLTRVELSCSQVDDKVLQVISQSHKQLKRFSLCGRSQVTYQAIEALLHSKSLPHLEGFACSPPRTILFPPQSNNTSNNTTEDDPVHEPQLAWGFAASDLRETTDSFSNNSASHGSVTSSDASWRSQCEGALCRNTCSGVCEDDECGWLKGLQKARPGIEISSCASLRWTSPAAASSAF